MTVAERVPRQWVPPLVVLATGLIIFVIMQPWYIFSANTPSGGDMGAHVYGPAQMRDSLLPSGRIQGWSMDWFAGFPLFYFYFPLPSLLIVAFDLFLPYGVAFKIATILGLVGLPPAVYYLTRSLRFSNYIAAITAAGSLLFVLMESFSIYGANIASTLAGEFSFSWSFSLGLVYIGMLIRAVEGNRRMIPAAAAAFALAALSHILTTIILVAASAFILLRRGASRVVLPVWVWAAALTAFWSLPFVVRIGLSTDMAWTPLGRWEEVFPVEIWLLIPLGVAGAVWAIRRTVNVLPVIALTLLPIIYYPLPRLLSEVAPEMFGEGRFKLWNGRLLPYWYFGVVFFASIAVAAFVLWLARRLPEKVSIWWPRALIAGIGFGAVWLAASREEIGNWPYLAAIFVVLSALGVSAMWKRPVSSRATLTAGVAAVILLSGLAGLSFVSGWARWNYSGYEGKEAFGEYMALMETMDTLETGRVHWEYNRDQDRYGTPMALMLIPYWTGAEHASMEGLFFESSLTVPFHFLNQAEMSKSPSSPVPGLRYRTFDFERGIPHLQLYGIHYYISFTPEAREKAEADGRLTFVTETGPFAVFDVEGAETVSVATRQPAVYTGEEKFGEFALSWYDDVANLEYWVVEDGPDDWPTVANLEGVRDAPSVEASGAVTDVELDDHRISFRTSAVGVPHMVKVSYFPNWTASGADGPYRATPSLMVVVPTSEEVVLEFGRTWVEWMGILVSLLAIGALVFTLVFDRSPSKTEVAEAPDE